MEILSLTSESTCSRHEWGVIGIDAYAAFTAANIKKKSPKTVRGQQGPPAVASSRYGNTRRVGSYYAVPNDRACGSASATSHVYRVRVGRLLVRTLVVLLKPYNHILRIKAIKGYKMLSIA